MNIVIKPIGEVRNSIQEPLKEGWEEVISELSLDTSIESATEGLEKFSHIIVIFWMHKVPRGKGIPTKVHPQGRLELPLVGLFATRTPYRPNPVGVSIVRLLGCQGNILKVKGLDAIDGTPVIDIKPYLPRDSVPEAIFPQWVAKLRQGYCETKSI